MIRLAVLLATVVTVACSRPAGPPAADPPATAAPLTPAQIAERALPSVVLIRAGDMLGTGFVIWRDGRIATNLHVIWGQRTIEVELPDGRKTRQVEVMAIDKAHDLAVLRVPVRGLVPLELGDSDATRPGARVVAIGHPLGLGNTVSDGLVSAVRELGKGGPKILQISAPIAQGSSGGPLIADDGKVVGVAFMVVERGQNLNFAIPVNYLKPLLLSDQAMPFAEFARITAPTVPAGAGTIVRNVPVHPVALLDDCALPELERVYTGLLDAISLGAPLYNQGNHAACYRIYDSAALELDTKVTGCQGIKQALAAGRARAQQQPDDTLKAWAMRDAFDGVLLVIDKKVKP